MRRFSGARGRRPRQRWRHVGPLAAELHRDRGANMDWRSSVARRPAPALLRSTVVAGTCMAVSLDCRPSPCSHPAPLRAPAPRWLMGFVKCARHWRFHSTLLLTGIREYSCFAAALTRQPGPGPPIALVPAPPVDVLPCGQNPMLQELANGTHERSAGSFRVAP